ncbi:MAG: peptidylprolyl isomerase [Acidimicrobiales bacterium]|nr:peptidylprolyl isomerase [Acidimicrobiales bacterium]
MPSLKLFTIPLGIFCALVTTFLFSCGSAETPPEESSSISPTVESEETPKSGPIPQEVLFSVQVAEALIGEPVSGRSETCLFSAAQNNQDFADAITAVISNQELLSGKQFTDLVTGVRDCVSLELMNEAIAIGLSLGVGNENLFQCLMAQTISAESDDAFVGLAAVTVGYPIPAAFGDATVDVLTACVSHEILASQLSLQYLQAEYFMVDVDQDCLVNELDVSGVALSFWKAAFITQDSSQLAVVAALVESCAVALHEGLLEAVPEDFIAWAGERTLREVAPPARVNTYSSAPPMTIETGATYLATVTTADGEMIFELFAETAPVTVNNFINLVNDGFYDGLLFHRVLEDFMAQSGDPTGLGTGGPGYQFADEVDNGPPMEARGLLAMANSGPGTNGSQFFITFAPTSHLTGKHTVFGQLIGGDDVLSAIDLRDPEQPTSRGEVILTIQITEQ